jgi:hypothetical protein
VPRHDEDEEDWDKESLILKLSVVHLRVVDPD